MVGKKISLDGDYKGLGKGQFDEHTNSKRIQVTSVCQCLDTQEIEAMLDDCCTSQLRRTWCRPKQRLKVREPPLDTTPFQGPHFRARLAG